MLILTQRTNRNDSDYDRQFGIVHYGYKNNFCNDVKKSLENTIIYILLDIYYHDKEGCIL